MAVQENNEIEMIDENSFLVFDEDDGYSTLQFDFIMDDDNEATSE